MSRRPVVSALIIAILALVGACERQSPVAPSAKPRATLRDTAFRDRMVSASIRRAAGGGFDVMAPDSSCPEALRGAVIRCRRWSGGNGHWYAVIPAKAFFTDASSAAAGLPAIDGLRAHLATLTTAEELAFVLQEVLANLEQPTPEDAPLDAYWLGATADENRGDRTDTWRWTTGEPWQYTAWAAGEPNNGNETALSVWGAFSDRSFGTWNNLLPGSIPDNDLHKVWSLVEWAPESTSFICEVPVPTQFRYRQGDPRWGSDQYDSRVGKTMRGKGCAVTSLALALSFAGASVTPGELNAVGSQEIPSSSGGRRLLGFDGFGSVTWGPLTRAGSADRVRFRDFRSASRGALRRSICEDRLPVIAWVPSNPAHFVAVISAPAREEDTLDLGRFGIHDPGFDGSTLASYGTFETRGTVRTRSTGAQLQTPTVERSVAVVDDSVGVSLSGAGLLLLVTDQANRRVGTTGRGAAILEDLPGSYAFLDENPGDDDATTSSDEPKVMQVHYRASSNAAHAITVDALAEWTGTVRLYVAHDSAGGGANVFPFQARAGQRFRFVVLVDPTTANRNIIQRVDAQAPRPYQLTALCGTRFRVRNRSDNEVTATWDVYGTTERGSLQLPPRASETEFSEAIFSTVARGTVRLFVGGQQVDVKAPSNAACAN